mgnify:FL=1
MKKRFILLFTAICLLFNGCVSIVEPIVPTDTEHIEFSATEIVSIDTKPPTIPAETTTPTIEPTITNTPFPTIDKHPPTPTVERPVEWDIDPYIEYEVEGEYKGVKIKGSVIIDRSLESLIEGVYVNKNLFSEMIAKSLAYVWYSRRYNYYYDDLYTRFTGDEMDGWFELRATAQETGSEYYWRQIQLDNMWTNDLNDGDGYIKKQYAFWPMYEGPTPYGVTAIKKFTVMLFDTPKSNRRNATTAPDWVSGGRFYGVNLDNNNFIFYSGTDMDICIGNAEYIYGYSREYSAKILLHSYWPILTPYLIWIDGKNDFDTARAFDLVVSGEIYGLIERATEYKLKIE